VGTTADLDRMAEECNCVPTWQRTALPQPFSPQHSHYTDWVVRLSFLFALQSNTTIDKLILT
jgi:hypothetical protein